MHINVSSPTADAWLGHVPLVERENSRDMRLNWWVMFLCPSAYLALVMFNALGFAFGLPGPLAAVFFASAVTDQALLIHRHRRDASVLALVVALACAFLASISSFDAAATLVARWASS